MKQFELLGVRVACSDKAEILSQVIDWATSPTQRMVTYINAHCLNLAARDIQYRAILNQADLVYSDGIGVVWAGRLLGSPRMYKVTGRDWIDALCAQAVRHQLSLFLLAGKPGVAQKACDTLVARWPGLNITGVCDGYFEEKSENECLNDIRHQSPHMTLVGMGVPLQEKWIANHRAEIASPVVWAVGALFDYVIGAEASVPTWMERLGLEWLWRLWIDPRGKWKRYLVGNPLFVARILRQKLTG